MGTQALVEPNELEDSAIRSLWVQVQLMASCSLAIHGRFIRNLWRMVVGFSLELLDLFQQNTEIVLYGKKCQTNK